MLIHRRITKLKCQRTLVEGNEERVTTKSAETQRQKPSQGQATNAGLLHFRRFHLSLSLERSTNIMRCHPLWYAMAARSAKCFVPICVGVCAYEWEYSSTQIHFHLHFLFYAYFAVVVGCFYDFLLVVFLFHILELHFYFLIFASF